MHLPWTQQWLNKLVSAELLAPGPSKAALRVVAETTATCQLGLSRAGRAWGGFQAVSLLQLGESFFVHAQVRSFDLGLFFLGGLGGADPAMGGNSLVLGFVSSHAEPPM